MTKSLFGKSAQVKKLAEEVRSYGEFIVKLPENEVSATPYWEGYDNGVSDMSLRVALVLEKLLAGGEYMSPFSEDIRIEVQDLRYKLVAQLKQPKTNIELFDQLLEKLLKEGSK